MTYTSRFVQEKTEQTCARFRALRILLGSRDGLWNLELKKKKLIQLIEAITVIEFDNSLEQSRLALQMFSCEHDLQYTQTRAHARTGAYPS